jgi:hypothetical protein
MGIWNCAECGDIVGRDINGKPKSKYYLQDMSEVYCSAKCSLIKHERKKS